MQDLNGLPRMGAINRRPYMIEIPVVKGFSGEFTYKTPPPNKRCADWNVNVPPPGHKEEAMQDIPHDGRTVYA